MFNLSVNKLVNIFGVLIIVLMLGTVVWIFWSEDAKYALPTEKPINYKNVPLESFITTEGISRGDQPRYFHFFQPSCPCSRFNLKHYESLYKKYNKDYEFYFVIPPKSDMEWVNDLVDVEVQIIIDKEKKLANACGVYSTPQAAIINQDGKLYYRGNYNKGRYCTSKSTNFAEIALEALKQGRQLPELDHFAFTAYGCEYNKSN